MVKFCIPNVLVQNLEKSSQSLNCPEFVALLFGAALQNSLRRRMANSRQCLFNVCLAGKQNYVKFNVDIQLLMSKITESSTI